MRGPRHRQPTRLIDTFRRHRADVLALLVVCGAIVAGFFEIPFHDRTFSTAYFTASANGIDPPIPPEGEEPDVKADPVRIDQGASAWQFEPWGELVARAIRGGEWPLWNPYSATGKPLAANMQSAALDPLLLPVHLRATPLLWDLCFLFALLLGGAGGYLYLRNLGLQPVASVAGAVSFSLSGYFFLYSNNQFFRSYLYLPWLFLGVDRVVRSRRPLPVLGLALAMAGNFLVGMPESTLFVIGATMAYSVFRIVTSDAPLPAFATVGAAGALALALVLPLAVLLAEYVDLSHNSHPPEAMIGTQADPSRWLLNWFVPFSRGRGSFLGLRQWLGAAVPVAALAGLAGHRLVRRTGAWFVGLLGVLVIAKIYGAPYLSEVGRLPLVVRASFPAFAAPVAAFGVSVLAAVGVQAAAERQLDRRVLLGGLALLVGGVAWLAEQNRSELLRGFDGVIPFAGAIAAAALAAGAALWQGRRAAVALTVVLMAELLLLAPRGIYAERLDPYSPTPAMALMRQHGLEATERTFAFDAKLFPDIPGVFGIADVRTIDGLYPKRFFTYVQTFIQPTARTRYVGGPHGGEPGEEVQRSEVARNPMWDLLGVRYVLSGGTVPEESSLLARIFASRPPDAAVRATTFDIGGDTRSVLFEHSEQSVSMPVDDPMANAMSFSYGLHPDAFADPGTDGVEFVVSGRSATGGTVELFRAAVVPRVDPVQPEWRTGRVALDGPGGPFPELILEVRPRGNSMVDWAGWADIHFEGAGTVDPPSQYEVIGTAGNTTVYRNTRAAPRAFVVHDVTGVRDVEAATRRFQAEGRFPGGAVRVTSFNPLERAVVEGVPSRRRECSGRSDARISLHEAHRVVVQVRAACAGLLVLTDTHYPGWKAQVDGRPARIHATDILFRGVFVGAGDSTVVFEYAPSNFRLGLIGPPAGLSAWALWAVRSRRRRAMAPSPGADPLPPTP